MAPSFRQRVGLRPFDLPPQQRRMLVGARAASVCFVIQGTLALVAAAAAGDLGLWLFVAAGASYASAVLLICRYERLPRSVNHLLALGATSIVALLTFVQPAGERYALLYVGVVVYVTFFF